MNSVQGEDATEAAAADSPALPDLLDGAHWPYAGESCRATLDLDTIELLAIRVLARGLLTQRLVAFVGAGVSAAYGRMTWTGLLRLLWDRIEAAVAAAGPETEAARAWQRVRRDLWKNDVAEFLAYSDHAVKAQVLSSIAALLPVSEPGLAPGASPGSTADWLQFETNWYLQDFHGFVDGVVEQLTDRATSGPAPGPAPDDEQARLKVREQARRVERDTVRKGPGGAAVGLKPVLGILAELTSKLPVNAAGAPPGPAVESIIRALSHQPTSQDSPLRLLANEWGLRRFITTNYDREIERGLTAAGFVAADDRDGKVNANQYQVLNFSQHVTGQALRFALEGPRRHAALLHLHGDVTDAASLIVTESQYQRLYLDDHPLRDLVNNATLANFAANSMLFVGSDVGEDDVLRPMRQFMTGQGHRRDRMAVALFITNQPAHKRAQRRAQLWLKYGVFAIDIGAAKVQAVDGQAGGRVQPEDLWLVRLMAIQGKFRKPDVPADTARPDADTRALQHTARLAAAAQLRQLGVPIEIEGIAVIPEREFDFATALSRLTDVIQALPPIPLGTPADTDFHLQRALLLFDTTVSWISGCFLSAKLISLRQQCVKVIEEDVRLALPYQRPPHAYAITQAPSDAAPGKTQSRITRPPAVNVRHAVMQAHPLLGGRFHKISAGESEHFDEGIGELCQAIESSKDFRSQRGRRVIIACASRGQGKGGQCDRLVGLGPNGEQHPYLRQLLGSLQGYSKGKGSDDFGTARVVHANLSFSNELGTIISQVISVMASMWAAPEPGIKDSSDQLEQLGRAMHGLTQPGCEGRLLLVLGNAGVLFDTDGEPKNGQIRRVMHTLLADRYAKAKLDILMYIGESQIPAAQRLRPGKDDKAKSAMQASELGDMRRRRRLHRLSINGQPPDGGQRVLVHALRGARVSSLARAYFPNAAAAMGWAIPPPPTPQQAQPEDEVPSRINDIAQDERHPVKGSPAYELALRLYRSSGGSRFAQTLLLAWMDTAAWLGAEPSRCDDPCAAAREAAELAFSSLRSVPAASAVEAVVEFVLDHWGALHLTRSTLPDWVLPAAPISDNWMGPPPQLLWAVRKLTQPLTPQGWALATEIMWHLAAFSHPVEANVLAVCPRVAAAAKAVADQQQIKPYHCIAATLELLTHWCLIFRIQPRPLPMRDTANDATPAFTEQRRIRYAPHRHMQRHFLRLMGGRNVESTAWDQFTTTLYASLPDESPLFRPEVHQTLVAIVHRLTGYPKRSESAGQEAAKAALDWNKRDTRDAVHQSDCIRAAYYLVRSTYSMGVVSHLTAEASDQNGGLGHMEQYRRLVRWITHAARSWESRHGIRKPGDGTAFSQAWCGKQGPRGMFYPGELVWLYNECGVISLAQGKLHDAEQLLTMAESAARLVEADDTGSLHTRIRLQSALVQIERGRPHRAQLMLRPISDRKGGHPVLPLLAKFYLGLVEHLGGNHDAALRLYDTALAGLRAAGRARACAFVLMGKADVEYALHPAEVGKALAIASEAISLAQQGGHEDLRVMATVARARICVDAGRTDNEHLFEHLNFAQRYAVLMDIPRLSCEVHELRARMLMRQGEYHLSAHDATVGLEIAAMYDLKLKKARGLLTLSEIYLRRGETAGARSLAAMGQEIAVSCDYYSCVRGFKELELMLHPASGVAHR